MVEEQVEVVVLFADLQVVLAPHKCEARAHLQQEVADMLQQAPFKVALLSVWAEGEKVEVVRVFENLLCQVGLWRRQRLGKVGERASLPAAEIIFDL